MSIQSLVCTHTFLSVKILSGWLRLPEDKLQEARKKYPDITTTAQYTMEYGKNKDGYFEGKKFLTQATNVLQIASVLWPDKDHVWCFDHSGVHKRMADDALNASRMNLNDGGKQPKMRTTKWNGQVQHMVYTSGPSIGEPKGLRTVLIERGLWRDSMLKDDAMKVLSECEDFKNEKSELEHLVEKFNTPTSTHSVLFLPKYHCEFNPIELAWASAKDYARKYCGYSIVALRKIVPEAIKHVCYQLYVLLTIIGLCG